MTTRRPTSINLSAAALEYLDALAAHHDRSRSNLLERLIRRIQPPTELTPAARRCRELHHALDTEIPPSEPKNA